MKARTRRRWRRLYRRSRIYIPVVILLLLGMAFFLPLSTPWLRDKIQAEVSKELGFDVTFERARVYLATGEVDLYGVTVPGDGGEPFRVGHVALDGTIGELLTGAGQWPREVLITDPPVIDLVHTEQGIRPTGALETLIHAIQTRKRKPDEKTDEKDDPFDRATPAITVRNLEVHATPPSESLPPVTLIIDEAVLAERTEAGDSLTIDFEGAIRAGSTETIQGQILFRPSQELAQARLLLSGIKGDFRLPGLGMLYADARALDLEAWANRRADGNFDLSAEINVTRFELQESQVGGEQWVDNDLSIRARGLFLPREAVLRDINFGISGNEIDIRAAGQMQVVGDMPGEARIVASRIPAAVLTLARREAAQEGVVIDPLTSPTLRLDLEANGPFLAPMELKYQGTVALADWRVSQPSWPSPLDLKRVNGSLTNESLDLPVIEVGFGSLSGSGTAHIPLPRENEETTATIEVSLRGKPESLVAMLKTQRVMPRILDDVSMPVALDIRADVPVRRDLRSGDALLVLARGRYKGMLNWEQGEVRIRELPRPISIASGRINFTEAAASLEHLRASYDEMSIDSDLYVRADRETLWDGTPVFEGSVRAGGPVPAIVDIISQHALLPVTLKTATGEVHVEIMADGRFGAWDQLRYSGSLALRDASAIIDQPLYPVNIDHLNIEAEISPELVRFSRFSGRVEEAGLVSGTIDVTSGSIVMGFEAESPLWVVEHLIPRDTDELVMEGSGRANGTVKLIAEKPLPAKGDIAQAWIAAFSQPAEYPLGVLDGSTLRLDIDARIYPGAGATVFHRDFPQRISNVSGDITADEFGFHFNKVNCQIGDAQNAELVGFVRLGHTGDPVTIGFDLHAPFLNINDWLDGWGEQPWAERPYVPPRGKRRDTEKLQTIVNGRVRLERTEFLSVNASEIDAEILYRAWRLQPNTLDVAVEKATVYGGNIIGSATVTFPRAEKSHFSTSAYARNVEMQPFLQDLLDEPQEFVGVFTGHAAFGGTIGDYSTWQGEGRYLVTNSRFIGGQVMKRLSTALKLGREDTAAGTHMYGTSNMRESKIYFPDMVIENSRIKMMNDGFVALSGDLNFFVTVELLTNRFDGVPVVRRFVDAINALKNALISLRVEGTVHEPEVRASSLQLDKLQFFETNSRPIEEIRAAMNSGAKQVEADRERIRERMRSPEDPLAGVAASK